LLIEPAAPDFGKFVARGDSGSLLVDEKQNALGLIFAGTSEAPELPRSATAKAIDTGTDKPVRIEGYGVANPIGEVLDRLKIELLL